jgi:hypothetical protein
MSSTTSTSDPELKAEAEVEAATGVRGPVSWWLVGLVAILVIAAGLLAMHWLGGNTGTAVYSGSPVAAPQTEAPSVPVSQPAVEQTTK